MPTKQPSVLQGYFGGTSLMPAMRRAFEFSELLTETSYLFVIKKTTIILIYNKYKTENIKIHHFKDKIVKQNKIKKKPTFGMFLIPAMRRASKFRELLTEKSSIFVLKKAAIIFNYDKNKTESIQIHHFKDEIFNQNTKKIRHSGTEPRSEQIDADV